MATRRRKSPTASTRRAKKPEGEDLLPTTDVHEIEVTLSDTRPSVWRRVLVPGDMPLERFHRVLQIAMGWEEYHLHRFRVGNKRYSSPESGLDEHGDLEVGDERRCPVAKAFKDGKGRIVYEYDFGDGWEHDLRVVAVHSPKEAPSPGPACIAGERACPPEDVGGIPGYENLLAAMADPGHPEHEDVLEWVGEEFDPGRFDMEAVNRELKELR